MAAIISLFIVITLSMLIIKIATVALTYTGLAYEVARFQARSAFTGVGFTTNETEKIVNHPVRRKIILLLMLGGNAGIVTAIATLVLTFVNLESRGGSLGFRVLAITIGIALIWLFSSSKIVNQKLSSLISWALAKYTNLDIQDYSSLLHMAGEYRVVEFGVTKNDWLNGKQLQQLNLQAEGILVLGITREDGTYIGAPNGATHVIEGDTLILYGRTPAFEDLDGRRRGKRGDEKHKKAISEQKRILKESSKEDPAG